MNGSNKHKITINTDGITPEQKATAKFQAFYQGMLAQLSQPGFADVLCAHEAAHLVFFTIAGMKEYEPRPAWIEYDPKIDDYVGNLAGIQIVDIPTWTQGQFWQWFNAVACGHAAGGVVARKLRPNVDCGDEDDEERFYALCGLINKDPSMNIDAEKCWKAAQDTVAKMLDEKPELMAVIQAEAEKLKEPLGL